MLKNLIKVANRLDNLGLSKEADLLDSIIKKIAASAFEMAKYDDRKALSGGIAGKMVLWAKNHANKEIGADMLEVYYEDTAAKIDSMLQDLERSINDFDPNR